MSKPLYPEEIAYPLHLRADGFVYDSDGRPLDASKLHEEFVFPFAYDGNVLRDANGICVNPEDWYRSFGGCAFIGPAKYLPGAVRPETRPKEET